MHRRGDGGRAGTRLSAVCGVFHVAGANVAALSGGAGPAAVAGQAPGAGTAGAGARQPGCCRGVSAARCGRDAAHGLGGDTGAAQGRRGLLRGAVRSRRPAGLSVAARAGRRDHHRGLGPGGVPCQAHLLQDGSLWLRGAVRVPQPRRHQRAQPAHVHARDADVDVRARRLRLFRGRARCGRATGASAGVPTPPPGAHLPRHPHQPQTERAARSRGRCASRRTGLHLSLGVRSDARPAVAPRQAARPRQRRRTGGRHWRSPVRCRCRRHRCGASVSADARAARTGDRDVGRGDRHRADDRRTTVAQPPQSTKRVLAMQSGPSDAPGDASSRLAVGRARGGKVDADAGTAWPPVRPDDTITKQPRQTSPAFNNSHSRDGTSPPPSDRDDSCTARTADAEDHARGAASAATSDDLQLSLVTQASSPDVIALATPPPKLGRPSRWSKRAAASREQCGPSPGNHSPTPPVDSQRYARTPQ
eukprot:ctg_528.g248